jgi:hypothetical protein
MSETDPGAAMLQEGACGAADTPTPAGWQRAIVFGAALGVYVWYALPLYARHKEHLLADVNCYVRRAMYLCRGDIYHAISGYWSPLMSWCIAPLIYFGVDGVYAAHIVVAVAGGVLVAAFGLFLYNFTTFHWAWKLLAMVIVAMGTALATTVMMADMLLAACLLGYFAVMVSPGLMRCRGMQLLAGVLGGVAYLAKAYAFPFVLIHLPMTLVIRGWGEGKGQKVVGTAETAAEAAPTGAPTALKRAGMAWLVTMAGFALVAGPWVGVLSWRYGHVTFSTVGARAHAVVGPAGMTRAWAHFGVQEDPYITAAEIPETVPYDFWSPLESRALFEHQMRVIRNNAMEMGRTLMGLDRWRLAAVAMLLAPLAGLGLLEGPGQRWKGLWLLGTMALFCSGFLPLYFSPRYIWMLLLPLGVVLCWRMALELRLPRRWGGLRGWVRAALVLCLAGSFFGELTRLLKQRMDDPVSGMYRQLAGDLKRLGLRGPIASPDLRRANWVALHAGEKSIGFPPDPDLDVIERRLSECHTGILLLWKRAPREEWQASADRAAALVARGNWKCVYTRSGAEVYIPAWMEAPATQKSNKTRRQRRSGQRVTPA